MNKNNYDFYQELRFRTRQWLSSEDGSSNRWAEYLMFAPDLFHLLCKLALDIEVPVRERVKLAAVIAYFVSPFDLFPEALVGFLGFADDIALTAYALNSLVNRCDPELLRKHWAGEEDVLQLVQRILRIGDSMVGKGWYGKRAFGKIRRMFR